MRKRHKQLSPTASENTSTNVFSDQIYFMESLKSENAAAVRYAIELGFRFLKSRYHFINDGDLNNLATDATVLVIHKIQQNAYRYEGNKLSTYLCSVAINLYRNFARKNNLKIEDIEDHAYRLKDAETNIHQKMETQGLVAHLLSKIPDACRQLLELKYFKQYSDKEIIELGLVHYKSVGAIKNKRSKCLRDLQQLIKSNPNY